MRNNNDLVGSIRISRMPYYDSASQRVKYKGRPILLLKAEKGIGESDFSILPISSISHKENIDEIFDIEVTAEMYPLLKLNKDISYIRCAKISTVHSSTISKDEISNLKEQYPELWDKVVLKLKEYINLI